MVGAALMPPLVDCGLAVWEYVFGGPREAWEEEELGRMGGAYELFVF
jgi:hypothetical protein